MSGVHPNLPARLLFGRILTLEPSYLLKITQVENQLRPDRVQGNQE